jgi:hypothetical protein
MVPEPDLYAAGTEPIRIDMTGKQTLNLGPGASDKEGQALLVDALSNSSDQVKFDGRPETHLWHVHTPEFND